MTTLEEKTALKEKETLKDKIISVLERNPEGLKVQEILKELINMGTVFNGATPECTISNRCSTNVGKCFVKIGPATYKLRNGFKSSKIQGIKKQTKTANQQLLKLNTLEKVATKPQVETREKLVEEKIEEEIVLKEVPKELSSKVVEEIKRLGGTPFPKHEEFYLSENITVPEVMNTFLNIVWKRNNFSLNGEESNFIFKYIASLKNDPKYLKAKIFYIGVDYSKTTYYYVHVDDDHLDDPVVFSVCGNIRIKLYCLSEFLSKLK